MHAARQAPVSVPRYPQGIIRPRGRAVKRRLALLERQRPQINAVGQLHVEGDVSRTSMPGT
jgi:hypothetical protein